jgi:high-affinity Fe2+/Pb2+ permease
MEKAKASEAGEAAPSRKHAWSVLILAASAVLREGIESVIFLAGGWVWCEQWIASMSGGVDTG